MKKLLIIIFIAFCHLALAQDSNSDLWQKAVDISKRNNKWIPGLLKTEEKIVDNNGELVHVSHVDLKVFRLENGKLSTEVIKMELSEPNSIDMEDTYSLIDDELVSDPSEEPFDPNFQESISNISLFGIEIYNDIVCEKYSYEQLVDGVKLHGMAWLEKTSGRPLKIEFVVKKKIKEDDYTITKLKGILLYNDALEEEWYPIDITYKIDIETKYLLFFTFNGHVEEKIYLSNYFK